MARESVLKDRICSEAERSGACVFQIVASMLQESGLPDTMFMYKGRVIMIEFKGTTTPWKQHQRIKMYRINQRVPGLAFGLRSNNNGSGGTLLTVDRGYNEIEIVDGFVSNFGELVAKVDSVRM